MFSDPSIEQMFSEKNNDVSVGQNAFKCKWNKQPRIVRGGKIRNSMAQLNFASGMDAQTV